MLILLATACVSSAATLTTIAPPPLQEIRLTSVSGDGRVVAGYFGNTGGGASTAFRWSAGVTQTLGDLPGVANGTAAQAISGDGATAIGSARASTGKLQTVRWSAAGVPEIVEPALASTNSPRGVSRDGAIVVGEFTDATHTEAFRYSPNTGAAVLGDLPGGQVASHAWGVSADGSTAVGFSESANGREAFRWTAAEGMVGLGDLGGSVRDEFDSYATAVSADGNVIVGRGYRDQPTQPDGSGGGYQAVRWTTAGIESLGDLPGGSYGVATGVSGDGATVVGRADDVDGANAFIWTEANGMRKLWDVLLAAGVNPADQGWDYFSNAAAISADGTTIVGYGRGESGPRGFVIVVPEPTASAMLFAGMMAIARRRRCNQS